MLAPGIPLTKLRLMAVAMAPGSLLVFDQDLQIVKGTGWGKHLLRRASDNASSERTKLWLRRLAHPGEAEIPLRARAAQVYGVAANRLRSVHRETPLRGDDHWRKASASSCQAATGASC